jgi:hypothetical protein
VAQLAASGLAGWFVLMGVLRIRASRVAAFRMFERAIVTSILLVQVFSFYSEQFAALVELLFNLTILTLVRAAIGVEEAARGGGVGYLSAFAASHTLSASYDHPLILSRMKESRL